MKKQLLFLLFFIPGVLSAQTDTGQVKQITLSDDSQLTGYIISEDSSIIQFETLSGVKADIPKYRVNEIEDLEGSWRGAEFLPADPNKTRLFFAPNGKTLKQGEGYFSTYEIFFPFLSLGLTDFITLSGGFSLFPGAKEQLVYVAPKVRFLHLRTLDVSSGILYSHINEEDFGIAYGVFTYGTEQASFTGGLGWGFVNGKYAKKPVIMIGGEVQISRSVKIITENWIPPESDINIISIGFRFFGRSLAADFGLITTTNASDGFPFLPWVGFAYNF